MSPRIVAVVPAFEEAEAIGSVVAEIRAFDAAICSLPGRLGSLMNSCAIGENSTSRGADLPLYFWLRTWSMNLATFSLNFGRPASPANDSL